ncbi:hypothetical protein QTP70_031873, partial [Hemibagrus guttatus]
TVGIDPFYAHVMIVTVLAGGRTKGKHHLSGKKEVSLQHASDLTYVIYTLMV